MGNASARRQSDQSGKSKWQTNVFFIAEKTVIFFLSNGLSYKLDFCVINSPKPQLSEDIFVFKINYLI